MEARKDWLNRIGVETREGYIPVVQESDEHSSETLASTGQRLITGNTDSDREHMNNPALRATF